MREMDYALGLYDLASAELRADKQKLEGRALGTASGTTCVNFGL